MMITVVLIRFVCLFESSCDIYMARTATPDEGRYISIDIIAAFCTFTIQNEPLDPQEFVLPF